MENRTRNSKGKKQRFSSFFTLYIIFTICLKTDLFDFREILRHIQRLANPVLYKHSRQTLLRLRQRYPEKFQVNQQVLKIFDVIKSSWL